jgi:hypothetical protein
MPNRRAFPEAKACGCLPQFNGDNAKVNIINGTNYGPVTFGS